MKALSVASLLILMVSFVQADGDSGENTPISDIDRGGEIYGVGEVKFSLFSPKQFQERYGSVWVLMDGRTLGGTRLGEILVAMPDLPDSRGKFLRVHNNGYECQGDRSECKYDPEVGRTLGSYQGDAIKFHRHMQSSNGNTAFTSGEPGDLYGFRPKVVETRNSVGAKTKINDNANVETRPKNIAINIFVKIDRCSSAEVHCK